MKRGLALLAAALVSGALATACGDGENGAQPAPSPSPAVEEPTATPVPEPSVDCSAAGLPETPDEQPGLPDAVEQLRRDIVAAAVACDYDRLESLALQSGLTFNYSFDEPEGGRPGAFWRQNEEQGGEDLATLVRVLNLDYGEIDAGLYGWPFAQALDLLNLSDEDQAALDALLSENGDIAAWQDGVGYTGYRAGITAGGDWTFFVAGD